MSRLTSAPRFGGGGVRGMWAWSASPASRVSVVASWAGADAGDGGGKSAVARVAHVDRGGPDREAGCAASRRGGESGGVSGGQDVAGLVDVDVDDVLVAEQAGNGRVGRVPHQVGGGSDLAQLARDEHGDAVGEGEDLLGAVGDEHDRGRAVGEDAVDVGEEGGAGRGVEARGGLVEKQRVGVAGEGSREADALGLAAGQAVSRAVGEVLDAQARQRGGGDGLAGGSGRAAIAKRQLDVVADGRGEQDGALGRVGEPAAKGRAAVRCGRRRRRGSRRRSVRRYRRAGAAGSSCRRR